MPSSRNAEIARLVQTLVDASHENEASFSRSIAETLTRSENEDAPALSITECHVIAAIGTTPGIKAAMIADQLGMTRGGISKMIKRLEHKGYLKSEAKPDNLKEVDLALTPLGKSAYAAHEQLHEQKRRKLDKLLNRYSDDEKDLVVRILRDAISEEGLLS